MMPRLLLTVLFALAAVPIAAGVVVSSLTDLPPSQGRLLLTAGTGLNVILLLVALLDLLLSPSLASIEVEREYPEVMSVGARNRVQLVFRNRNAAAVRLRYFDSPPEPCGTAGLPNGIVVPPEKPVSAGYHVVPLHRGENRFGPVYLHARSLFGLWTLHEQRPLAAAVKIYPDIQAVRGMELLARRNRLAESGLRLSKLRGRGNEFDRLREYRREDEYRSIDWKATARHQELISREYVVERNQSVLIVLDCGRTMSNEVDGISHFDRALNAAIMLSYVALRQGDYVGCLAFSNEIERWVRPVRGTAGLQTLIRHLYNLRVRLEASDYRLLAEQIRLRFRKRALVIVLTHAQDSLQLAMISHHLRTLRTPHLVLAALLKNVHLMERLSEIPQTDLEAFQLAAAAEMVLQQTREAAEMQRKGLLVLDTLPDQLSANLVSRYLDVKARHLL